MLKASYIIKPNEREISKQEEDSGKTVSATEEAFS
jgi:hypothetical protein